jgi:hypothetical protein
MQLARLGLGAGALLAAGALALALGGRAQPPRAGAAREVAAPAPVRAAAVDAAPPQAGDPGAGSRSEPRVTGGVPAPRSPSDSASRGEVDLVALEDEALRQIDVIPLLEAAGVDVARLRARPDAGDVLRHVAADELLTRAFMRELLSTTVYPYGYPRDTAMYDARSAADRMMAALSPEARAEALGRALADGSSELPEPTFYSRDSGRTYAAAPDPDGPGH